MNPAVANAASVFGLVAAGVVVAGVLLGQAVQGVLLGLLVGAAFATATYLLFRGR